LLANTADYAGYIHGIYETFCKIPMKNKLTDPLVILTFSLIACFLWGSAYPVNKIGYKVLEIVREDAWGQVLFAGYRFIIAGILIFTFCLIGGQRIRVRRGAWPKITLLGLLMTTGQYGLFYMGLANTTGINASILASTYVFFNVVLSALLVAGERLTLVKVAGVLLGTTGVAVVFLPGSGGLSPFTWRGDGLILAAELSISLGSVYFKKLHEDIPVVMLTSLQMVIGAMFLVVPAVIVKGFFPFDISTAGLLTIGYLALLSAVAFSLWNQIIRHNPIGKVSIYLFLIPIFGVILSVLMLRETLNMSSLIGLVLVSVAIFIVNYNFKRFITNKVKA
jgi:drug/metabolite transporter (DMT)-like permease